MWFLVLYKSTFQHFNERKQCSLLHSSPTTPEREAAFSSSPNIKSGIQEIAPWTEKKQTLQILPDVGSTSSKFFFFFLFPCSLWMTPKCCIQDSVIGRGKCFIDEAWRPSFSVKPTFNLQLFNQVHSCADNIRHHYASSITGAHNAQTPNTLQEGRQNIQSQCQHLDLLMTEGQEKWLQTHFCSLYSNPDAIVHSQIFPNLGIHPSISPGMKPQRYEIMNSNIQTLYCMVHNWFPSQSSSL